MQKKLGMKWFTFYVKIRPFLVIISFIFWLFNLTDDMLFLFSDRADIHLVPLSAWIMVFSNALTNILCLGIAVKLVFMDDDSENLFRVIKTSLTIDCISVGFGSMQNYFSMNPDDEVMLYLLVIAFGMLVSYFVWYRLNIKYFKRRLFANSTTINEAISEVNAIGAGEAINAQAHMTHKVKVHATQTPKGQLVEAHKGNKICFCRKCGNKLIEGSRFCNICGTEIAKE